MSSLPPPPPPIGSTAAAGPLAPVTGSAVGGQLPVDERAVRLPRPGELTGAWRTVVMVTWVGIVLVYASVWRTARTMGLSTWWLGPPAEPKMFLVQLLPFVAPIVMVIAASRPSRHLPIAGIVAGLAGAAIAAGDVGRFDRLALVEFAAAGAGLAVGIASFAGVWRSEPEIDRSIT